jgi:hypothetical protein
MSLISKSARVLANHRAARSDPFFQLHVFLNERSTDASIWPEGRHAAVVVVSILLFSAELGCGR